MTRPTPPPNSPTPGSPPPPSPRRPSPSTPGPATVAVLASLFLALAVGLALGVAAVSSPAPSPPQPDATPLPAPPQKTSHPVTIRQPLRTPRVDTGRLDPLGQPVTVSCSSCHATSAPRPDTRDARELDEFHQGLAFNHGSLSCLSCHNAANYDQLRLADGRGLDYADTMSLCAQCHGPQFRDYSRGSHGGMTGFWDLSRGPRQRNHCVDCHDPHAPQFPTVLPAFPLPRDRGFHPSNPAPHPQPHG